jgi:hypothetical protein
VVKPAVIVALVCAAELAQLDSASAETNISGNPFGLVLGYRYFDGAASHAVGNKLAATVAISCWDIDEYVRGWQLSATLPYYFRHAFSGPYLESGLIMRTAFATAGRSRRCDGKIRAGPLPQLTEEAALGRVDSGRIADAAEYVQIPVCARTLVRIVRPCLLIEVGAELASSILLAQILRRPLRCVVGSRRTVAAADVNECGRLNR